MTKAKKKIAVIGGGVGSMTAVQYITSLPDWDQEYEVTVYQMGWRLGGKGASGRDMKRGARIQEHGLHIWLGFYENAFHAIRNCYDEWGRAPGSPLATWDEAFKRHSLVTLMEYIDDEWIPWTMELPTSNENPGESVSLPKLIDYLPKLCHWLVKRLEESPSKFGSAVETAEFLGAETLAKSLAKLVDCTKAIEGNTPLHWMHQLVSHFDHKVHDSSWLSRVIGLLDHFLDWARHWLEHEVERLKPVEKDIANDIRRALLVIELGAATLRGMIRDHVFWRGFDSINDKDFAAWMVENGLPSEHARCAPMRSIYDLAFAYEDGDIDSPNLAAGIALRIMFRMSFTYKGAPFWKMQAGMGDVVFSPLYEVLKRRGVKFKFFYRTHNLALSDDRSAVESIKMGVQATIADDKDYEPLVDVNGLPCWPSEPLYEQLQQGDELQAQKVNLESAWTEWQNVDHVELRRGVDFDEVLLGVSVAGLPYICSELIDANTDWQAMVQHSKTTQTQAFQVWLNETAENLGYKESQRAQIGAYVEPLDTWADMSQLLPRETWPQDLNVRNVSYFCGVFSQPKPVPPPFSDPEFPKTQASRVKDSAVEFLKKDMRPLLPKSCGRSEPNDPDGFDWALLVDQTEKWGAARFDEQFWRANIDPSERYVLSVAGSLKYRLSPSESGFSNLTLAGDWTRTPLNAGCVEAAVMSGIEAARAVTGHPFEIIGEKE